MLVAPKATNIKNINQEELSADSCYKRTLKRIDTERRKARVEVSINANGALLGLFKKSTFLSGLCCLAISGGFKGVSSCFGLDGNHLIHSKN